MSKSSEHQFDAYCKKLLRHAAVNAHRARRRRASKTVTFSGLTPRELNQLYFYDSYDVDKQTVTTCGREVEIENESLYNALSTLKRDKRDILLLSACFDMTDTEISETLSIPRSTVQYRRKAAIRYIKKYMEEHQ